MSLNRTQGNVFPARPRRRHICLVGTIPEPIGGVAIHIARLAELCVQSGYTTNIYDLHPGGTKWIPQGCTLETKPTRWQAAVAYSFARRLRRFDLVHVHVSRLRTFLLLGLPTALNAGRLKRLVLTFHSGALTEDLQTLSWIELSGISRILRRCGKIVAVSARQSEALQEIARIANNKIAVIPAYLPVVHSSVPGIRERVEHRVVVASGYGTSLYGWHDLIMAIQRLPSTWQWVFCFYNSYEQAYYRRLRAECGNIPNLRCFEDLDPARFHTILQEADTYVRPTASDGDSIALREALALGLRCVASDVAIRPGGVVTYPVASVDALCESLLRLPYGRQEQMEEQFGGRILRVYDEVYEANQLLEH